jgi:hypothetical protein
VPQARIIGTELDMPTELGDKFPAGGNRLFDATGTQMRVGQNKSLGEVFGLYRSDGLCACIATVFAA